MALDNFFGQGLRGIRGGLEALEDGGRGRIFELGVECFGISRVGCAMKWEPSLEGDMVAWPISNKCFVSETSQQGCSRTRRPQLRKGFGAHPILKSPLDFIR